MQKEIAILKQKGYLVKVKKICDNTLIVDYPPLTVFVEKSEAFTKKYEIHSDKVLIDNEFVVLAPYLHRLAILVDILCQCRYAEIPPQLIFYYNEKGEEVSDIFKLIDINLSPDELKIENTLKQMLSGEDVPVDEQAKVFKSFKILKGLSL